MRKQPEAVLDNGAELRAYSPLQFAAALHLHIETVRAALREGRLRGFRVGSHPRNLPREDFAGTTLRIRPWPGMPALRRRGAAEDQVLPPGGGGCERRTKLALREQPPAEDLALDRSGLAAIRCYHQNRRKHPSADGSAQ